MNFKNMKPIISLSPHVHGGDSVQKNMFGVCIALIPALIASLYFFGLGSAIVLLTSVAACVFFEWAITRFILGRERLTICDGSAVLTGLLLGFNLPLVGRVFLLISFPVQMTSWPLSGQLGYLDAETGATPLALMKLAIKEGDTSYLDQLPSAFDMLVGQTGGSLGEVSALCLLIGCCYMIWKKIITWHIPVSILGTVFVLAGLFHLIDSSYANPVQVILAGGLMLGACFMATDYVTSPMTAKGQLIYGCAIGVLTVLIRDFGSYPEGMSFAILIMNGFTPLINTYVKPKRFGEVKK